MLMKNVIIRTKSNDNLVPEGGSKSPKEDTYKPHTSAVDEAILDEL